MKPDDTLERLVETRIAESAAAKHVLLEDTETIHKIVDVTLDLSRTFRQGRKLFLFGNGGSAADAQHIAAELVGRFQIERHALPAIALTVNTSCLTAIANDYSFDDVFSRQIEALAAQGDIAMGISTSGNSANVLLAIQRANAQGVRTIGMTGAKGGKLKLIADRCICVPSDDTPRIQEMHILVGHILCEIVERELFGAHRTHQEEFARLI